MKRKVEKMLHRLEKLLDSSNKLGMDGVLVSSSYNRRYLSGFTGSSGYLLILKEKYYLLTDFRYIEQATSQCPDYEVVDYYKKGLKKTLLELLRQHGLKKIGFENEQMTVKEFSDLQEALSTIKWINLNNTIERIRMIKDENEIELIAKAAKIGDEAFKYILTVVKPGMTEIEVANELEFFMKRQGASKLSFDTIVASGKRSSLPHAVPTEKKLENGDFVTLDFGCIYKGYCSDMTRTFVIGKASEKQKEIYNIVLKAQLNTCEKVKAGIKGKVGDAYARDIIDAAGYRTNFGHGLGHSLGLEVHEQPRFSLLSEDVIEEGMVMSIEPGIYIPDFGGVRIEDLVLITKNGIRNFCTSPKELIEV